MTLEQRIAAIIAQDCLSPEERAASILAQPEMARLRETDEEALRRIQQQQFRIFGENLRKSLRGLNHVYARP